MNAATPGFLTTTRRWILAACLTALLASGPPAIAAEDLLAAMGMDKKVQQKRLRFVLLKDLGQAYVTSDYDQDLLGHVLQATS